MDRRFQPEEFLNKLHDGAFDGHLHEELRKLSNEQLEQLVLLMANATAVIPAPEDSQPCLDETWCTARKSSTPRL